MWAPMPCSQTATCYFGVLQDPHQQSIERVDPILDRINEPIDISVSGARASAVMDAVAFGVLNMDAMHECMQI